MREKFGSDVNARPTARTDWQSTLKIEILTPISNRNLQIAAVFGVLGILEYILLSSLIETDFLLF